MRPITSYPATLIAAGTTRVRAALARRRTIARITGELMAMSNRDLADIGIGRSDIPRIARDAARMG